MIIARLENLVAAMPKSAKLCKYHIDATSSREPTQKLHIVSYLDGFADKKGQMWDSKVPECSELWVEYDQYSVDVTYRISDGTLVERTNEFRIPFTEDCCDKQLALDLQGESEDSFCLGQSPEKVTFTKPSTVKIRHYDGSFIAYDVNSWRAVLKTIAKYAMKYYPTEFTQMVEESDNDTIIGTLRGKVASKYYKLAPRMYLYQNLSASQIIKFCKHLIHAMSLDPKCVSIEIKNLRP